MDPFSQEFDGALFGLVLVFEEAGDGLQQRGLARTIWPQNCEDLLLPHLEGQTVEGVYPIVIERFNTGNLK